MIIGVTGVGSLIGQAIIKSLRQSGSVSIKKVIGFEYFKGTIGEYWVDETHILPDILKEGVSQEEWLDVLLKLIKQLDIRYLFVGVDFELPILAIHREAIFQQTGCTVIVSDSGVVAIGNDKYKTSQFLYHNGLPYPLSLLPEDDLIVDFPCIVKPRYGYRSRDVYLVHTLRDLDEKIKNVNQPVIQEYIPDESSEYTCGVLFAEDKIISSIALRRKLLDGNTAQAEFRHDFPQAIYSLIHRVAERLRPFGPCNLQLRIDKEGVPKIFEINPRFSGTTYMRALFGLNEVERMILFLEGINNADPAQLHEGVVKRYHEEFLVEGPR